MSDKTLKKTLEMPKIHNFTKNTIYTNYFTLQVGESCENRTTISLILSEIKSSKVDPFFMCVPKPLVALIWQCAAEQYGRPTDQRLPLPPTQAGVVVRYTL